MIVYQRRKGGAIVNNISVQLLGMVGFAASLIAFQCKRHKPIVVLRTVNELVFALQYFLLGAYTGTAMNLLGITVCPCNTAML